MCGWEGGRARWNGMNEREKFSRRKRKLGMRRTYLVAVVGREVVRCRMKVGGKGRMKLSMKSRDLDELFFSQGVEWQWAEEG